MEKIATLKLSNQFFPLPRFCEAIDIGSEKAVCTLIESPGIEIHALPVTLHPLQIQTQRLLIRFPYSAKLFVCHGFRLKRRLRLHKLRI